jgi:hypothetical protein
MTFPFRVLTILTAVALAGTALPALAETVLITAALSGADEVPPNDSQGTGTVDGTFDTETNVFVYRIEYEGLTGDATAAHFHGPASVGVTATPSLPIDGDLTSPIVGTVNLSDAQESELLGGLWYFNVHTAAYADGELRGQILQSSGSSDSSAISSAEGSPSAEMSSEQNASSEPSLSLPPVSISGDMSVVF